MKSKTTLFISSSVVALNSFRATWFLRNSEAGFGTLVIMTRLPGGHQAETLAPLFMLVAIM